VRALSHNRPPSRRALLAYHPPRLATPSTILDIPPPPPTGSACDREKNEIGKKRQRGKTLFFFYRRRALLLARSVGCERIVEEMASRRDDVFHLDEDFVLALNAFQAFPHSNRHL